MRTLQSGVMMQNTQEPEGQQQPLLVRCRPGEFQWGVALESFCLLLIQVFDLSGEQENISQSSLRSPMSEQVRGGLIIWDELEVKKAKRACWGSGPLGRLGFRYCHSNLFWLAISRNGVLHICIQELDRFCIQELDGFCLLKKFYAFPFFLPLFSFSFFKWKYS